MYLNSSIYNMYDILKFVELSTRKNRGIYIMYVSNEIGKRNYHYRHGHHRTTKY